MKPSLYGPRKPGRPIRTLGIDPGFKHTWYSLWEGMALVRCGHIPTPKSIAGILSPGFWAQLDDLFADMGLEEGDELVIERFTHRGRGGKGSMAETMHGIIDTVTWVALKRGMVRHLVVAGAHKVSYTKHHRYAYPRAMIEAKGIQYGTWRPKLKVMEVCLHVMDSMTLACYIIARRVGIIRAKGRRKVAELRQVS